MGHWTILFLAVFVSAIFSTFTLSLTIPPVENVTSFPTADDNIKLQSTSESTIRTSEDVPLKSFSVKSALETNVSQPKELAEITLTKTTEAHKSVSLSTIQNMVKDMEQTYGFEKNSNATVVSTTIKLVQPDPATTISSSSSSSSSPSSSSSLSSSSSSSSSITVATIKTTSTTAEHIQPNQTISDSKQASIDKENSTAPLKIPPIFTTENLIKLYLTSTEASIPSLSSSSSSSSSSSTRATTREAKRKTSTTAEHIQRSQTNQTIPDSKETSVDRENKTSTIKIPPTSTSVKQKTSTKASSSPLSSSYGTTTNVSSMRTSTSSSASSSSSSSSETAVWTISTTANHIQPTQTISYTKQTAEENTTSSSSSSSSSSHKATTVLKEIEKNNSTTTKPTESSSTTIAVTLSPLSSSSKTQTISNTKQTTVAEENKKSSSSSSSSHKDTTVLKEIEKTRSSTFTKPSEPSSTTISLTLSPLSSSSSSSSSTATLASKILKTKQTTNHNRENHKSEINNLNSNISDLKDTITSLEVAVAVLSLLLIIILVLCLICFIRRRRRPVKSPFEEGMAVDNIELKLQRNVLVPRPFVDLMHNQFRESTISLGDNTTEVQSAETFKPRHNAEHSETKGTDKSYDMKTDNGLDQDQK